jgi:hypothetical protein
MLELSLSRPGEYRAASSSARKHELQGLAETVVRLCQRGDEAKAAPCEESSAATVKLVRKLPASKLDLSALKSISDVLATLSADREWQASWQDVSVETHTFEAFCQAVSGWPRIDSLSIQSGGFSERTRACVNVGQYASQVEVTSTARPLSEVEDIANRVIDVAWLRARPIYTVWKRVAHPHWLVTLLVYCGLLVAALIAGIRAPWIAWLPIWLALWVYTTGFLLTSGAGVRVQLSNSGRVRGSIASGGRQVVLGMVGSLIATMLVALAAVVWARFFR